MIGEPGSNIDRYRLNNLLAGLDREIRTAWHLMHQFRKQAAEARAKWATAESTLEAYNHLFRSAGLLEIELRTLLRIRKAGRGFAGAVSV
jgi:hypothetical protein